MLTQGRAPLLQACDTADAWDNLQPHASNHRAACEAVMAQAACQQPLFSMQQDYSLHSGGATFEGVCCTSFGLGSAPLPIKGMPAGEWGTGRPVLTAALLWALKKKLLGGLQQRQALSRWQQWRQRVQAASLHPAASTPAWMLHTAQKSTLGRASDTKFHVLTVEYRMRSCSGSFGLYVQLGCVAAVVAVASTTVGLLHMA